MTLSEFAGLALRHWMATLVVIIVTLGVAVDFKHSAPEYMSTGSIVFSIPKSMQGDAARISSDNLIITAQVVSTWVMSKAGENEVAAKGGSAGYQLALVNFYNQQYPNYVQPLATLQSSSSQPAVAERTFVAALQVVQQRMRRQQVAKGTPPKYFITASLAAGSAAPAPQAGYSKRTYAGLLFLAIVAAYFLLTAIDRHPRWRAYLRFQRT